ncbi:MAG TPA: SusD/RagB family nutrient-binding outer membrane lipoprotein, partial [Balneolaceae bacterium]|nr:SusD/RagB family nutrient-binding outer membrane lipoprotein [Balneolaceae bacterium]
MKNRILFLTCIVPAFLLLLAGCDNYLGINDNPNATTNASPAGLLSSAEHATSQANYSAASVTSYYVQHLASPSGSSTDRYYEIRMDGTWSDVYGVLEDLKDLNKIAKQKNSPDYAGIAKVLSAINLGMATDLWGSVPYSQALQGSDNLTPAYDSQKEIYDKIFQLLNDAIDDLNQAKSTYTPGDDDYIYGGDMDKWLKTAYAVKARYLNHLSKKSSYDPKAVLDAVDKAYTGNDDDAQVPYTQQDINPWGYVMIRNAGGVLGGHLSDQLVEEMDGTIYGNYDPRLEQITDSLSGGIYRGTVNGKGNPNKAYNVLSDKSIYAQRTSPIYLVTYAEVKLIEAEAALRDGQRQRAYDAYMKGIRANMDKLGVSASERDKYMNNPNVDVGSANLTI